MTFAERNGASNGPDFGPEGSPVAFWPCRKNGKESLINLDTGALYYIAPLDRLFADEFCEWVVVAFPLPIV